MAGGNRQVFGDDTRTANAVLACLENDGPMSRASVAKRLDLSRTTLSNLISRFIDLKLVAELEGGDPLGRGRPGIPVDLDTSAWFALGAEFHSSRWVFVVANLKGEVVATKTIESSAEDPKRFVNSLTRGIQQMRGLAPGRLFPAVGVGAPGLVDRERGVIIRADDLGWREVNVRGQVEKATGYAAYVVNRNRATGMAEARFGLGRGVDNFIYIGVGTGISAAVMLGGRLVNGSHYGAGEIGHVTVDPKGPPCGCGRCGCLQTLAAGGAVARYAAELRAAGKIAADGPLARALAKGEELSGEVVCRAAREGDKAALACVRQAAGYLGMVAGSLVTTLNPEKIILGGPLVRVGPALVDAVREETGRWAMRHPFSQVAIERSDLDEYAGALGAACLVLENKLELSECDS